MGKANGRWMVRITPMGLAHLEQRKPAQPAKYDQRPG
jgi:hypothetical protein